MCNFRRSCAALGRRGRQSGRASAKHSVRVVGRFDWLWSQARASSLRNEAVRAARDKERGDGSHGCSACTLQLVDTEGKERAWAAWAAWDRTVLFIKTANNTPNLSLPKSTCDD